MADKKRALKANQELLLRTDYESRRTNIEALAAAVKTISEAAVKGAGLPYHSMKCRVKAIASSLEKIGRKRYEPGLDQVEDLVGVRVICLYPKHVEPVVSLLESQFTSKERIDKRAETASGQFGYSSIHLVCRLTGTPREVLPEYQEMEHIPFEIQVRTILQEAWAEIEHQLVYKSEVAAPADIRRQITRVSALLEVADKEFQDVYDQRQAYAEKLKRSAIENLREETLNIDSLLEVIARKLPWAKGWAESCDGNFGSDLSELLFDMEQLGVTTVQQLLRIIDKWHDEEYEESHEAYLIASGKKKLEAGVRTSFTDIHEDEIWHHRTEQYFLPIGFLRGVLRREFPHYAQARDDGQWSHVPTEKSYLTD